MLEFTDIMMALIDNIAATLLDCSGNAQNMRTPNCRPVNLWIWILLCIIFEGAYEISGRASVFSSKPQHPTLNVQFSGFFFFFWKTPVSQALALVIGLKHYQVLLTHKKKAYCVAVGRNGNMECRHPYI